MDHLIPTLFIIKYTLLLVEQKKNTLKLITVAIIIICKYNTMSKHLSFVYFPLNQFLLFYLIVGLIIYIYIINEVITICQQCVVNKIKLKIMPNYIKTTGIVGSLIITYRHTVCYL